MSEAEGFLSRWSRRKRDSDREGRSERSPGPEDPEVVTTEDGEATSAVAFDPASLPAIESISGGTDIRSFLLAGVPAALTQAALRRAWVTDPAVCDFIGIAENQWDFTDPMGIPGFGPLTAADELAGISGQMLASAKDELAPIADISLPAPPAAPATGAGDPPSVPAAPAGTAPTAEPSAAAEGDVLRDPPSHGGALPR
jgi:hypothetical protein